MLEREEQRPERRWGVVSDGGTDTVQGTRGGPVCVPRVDRLGGEGGKQLDSEQCAFPITFSLCIKSAFYLLTLITFLLIADAGQVIANFVFTCDII